MTGSITHLQDCLRDAREEARLHGHKSPSDPQVSYADLEFVLAMLDEAREYVSVEAHINGSPFALDWLDRYFDARMK